MRDSRTHEIARRAAGENSSMVHHDQPLTKFLRLFHVMGRQQNRDAADTPELFQFLPDFLAHLGIKTSSRLIQDQKPWVVQ